MTQTGIQKTRLEPRQGGGICRCAHKSGKVPKGFIRRVNQRVIGQHHVSGLIKPVPHLSAVRQPKRRAFGQSPAHFIIGWPFQHPRLLGQGCIHRVPQDMDAIDTVEPGASQDRKPEIKQDAQARILEDNKVGSAEVPLQKRQRRIAQRIQHSARRRDCAVSVKSGRVPCAAKRAQNPFVDRNQVRMFEKALLIFIIGVKRRESKIRAQSCNGSRHR